MRILIVHNILNDSTSVNGVLRHYTGMANEWSALGHPTDFLMARAGWPQVRELAPHSGLVSSDDIFNASGHLAQTWRNLPAYAYRLVSAHWVGLKERYDVIYASAQMIFEVYPSRVLARRQKAKLVVKWHHVLAAQPGRRGLFDQLYLRAERVSARLINRRADQIICSTEIVAKDYQDLASSLGLPQRKTHQIGYGADLTRIRPQWDAPKRFDAVFLGRMHEHKGVFELPAVWCEVLAVRPGARLLLMGEGPHRQRAEDMFRELGIAHSVTFTGGISEDLKNKYLVQSRVGISLSYEEGWGLSITEFLASGLPVVAYELPVFASVFPGQLDLVKPGDQSGMAQRILALLNDSERQVKQGREGRRFVERYDYRNIARAELEVLQS